MCAGGTSESHRENVKEGFSKLDFIYNLQLVYGVVNICNYLNFYPWKIIEIRTFKIFIFSVYSSPLLPGRDIFMVPKALLPIYKTSEVSEIRQKIMSQLIAITSFPHKINMISKSFENSSNNLLIYRRDKKWFHFRNFILKKLLEHEYIQNLYYLLCIKRSQRENLRY